MKLRGIYPVQITVKKLAELHVEFEGKDIKDIGVYTTVNSAAEIQDCHNPYDSFALQRQNFLDQWNVDRCKRERIYISYDSTNKKCQAGDIDVDKIKYYGYKNIGFILNRGYFSRDNLSYMDSSGFSFIIMVKGIKDFISNQVRKLKGTFENNWGNRIEEFEVYGKQSTLLGMPAT